RWQPGGQGGGFLGGGGGVRTLPGALAANAESGGPDRALPTAVGPRRRRNVHRGQADLAPAGGEHVLPVFGTVPPHLERSPRIDVGRRPEKVLADRPVMAAADRVVARDPLVERYARRRVVADVA